jgi:hypothetical protein
VLPLTLIAGLYGMNFRNMPELGWRWAYFAALGVMALIGLGLWLYFARRGFIGGPRLSRVPRALGHGLVGVVRLTGKPVVGLARLIAVREAPPGRAREPGEDGP